MLRTTHIARAPFVAITLIAAAACGGEKDRVQGEPAAESATAAVTPAAGTVVTTTDSATPPPVAPTVPVNVSFAEAESAFHERRYAEATEMFASYVDRRPDNPYGHYMLGLSAWKAGELDRARSSLERSLELDPGHVKSLLNLSRVLLEQGNAREALGHVTAAAALDSMSAEVHRLMGRVRAELRQPDEAVESYRVALSIDPTDAWSMNNMALVLIQRGRYEEALPPLARAVQIDSGVAVFQNNLGIALERTGRHTLAAQAYRAAVAVDGGHGKAAVSLARVEGRADDPSASVIELAELAARFDREIRSTVAVRPE